MGTNNSCKTAAVVGLIGRGPAAEATLLEEGHTTDLTRTPEIIYAEINFYSGTMLTSAIEIGRRMVELKEKLPHGSFIDEIKKNTPWSRSQINNFMRLFREYGNSNVQTFGHLNPSKALALLALPESEREVFLNETHEVDGQEKAVIDMSSRELDRVIKERNEALKAAETARAEQAAAEAAREKMSDDMKLANERLAGLTAEVEARTAQAREHQEEITRITAELEELRNRPVEVAVEADAAAVEAARKEAEAAMRDKLDQAKAAEEKAREDAENAANAVGRKEQELKQALAELEGLRAQAEKTEKRAALAANGDFVLFRTLFDQVQALLDRMRGVMANLRKSAPEPAEKMSKALLALSDKIREVALG